MKGLLSCIAVVGGVSVAIWLAFFVFLEPYNPSKSLPWQPLLQQQQQQQQEIK